MKSLKNLETYVDGAIAYFMTKMRERQGESIDMGLSVQLFAFGQSFVRQIAAKTRIE